jgi:hypothetical protein
MREGDLLAVQRKHFVKTTDSGHQLEIYLNLARPMKLTGIDQLWVADITYVPTDEGWLYLAGHKDLFTGEIVGYEYQTSIGRIDLLARHTQDPCWLVIELKRGQTSDETVGQVLRYMGWVREKLASPGDEVHGLIIAHEPDERLHYALLSSDKIELLLYDVAFHLHKPS